MSSEANLDTVTWNVQYVLANYLSGNSTIINILLHMWTGGLHFFYNGWLGVSRARLYRLVTSETIRVFIVITARKGILQRRWRGGCLVNQRGTSPTCTLCKSYNAIRLRLLFLGSIVLAHSTQLFFRFTSLLIFTSKYKKFRIRNTYSLQLVALHTLTLNYRSFKQISPKKPLTTVFSTSVTFT